MYRSKQYLTQSEKLNIVNSKGLKDALDEDYGVLSEDIKKSLKDWLFRNPTNSTTKGDFITKIFQNTKKAEKMVAEKRENLIPSKESVSGGYSKDSFELCTSSARLQPPTLVSSHNVKALKSSQKQK